jgi:hypothetical protein
LSARLGAKYLQLFLARRLSSIVEIEAGIVNQEWNQPGTSIKAGKVGHDLGIIRMIPMKVLNPVDPMCRKGIWNFRNRGRRSPSNAFNALAEESDPWP